MLDAPTAGASAIRGSALRSMGYVAGVGLSLIAAPFLVRHLGVSGFGVYVTITALVTVAGGISDFGLTQLGVREWAVLAPSDRRHLLAERSVLGSS